MEKREKSEIDPREAEYFRKATSQEGQRWLKRAEELADAADLRITRIEDMFLWGSVIHFARPEELRREAPVDLLYKTVRIDLPVIPSKSVMKEFWEKRDGSKHMPGYELRDIFVGVVKTVEMPEDAIQEVKKLLLDETLAEMLDCQHG